MRCSCSDGLNRFSLREVGPEPRHHRREVRKARGDEACVVDLYRPLACQSHHQRGHGDAMIHVRYDQSAAGNAAAAMHDQIVTIDFDFNAVVRAT